MNNSNDLYELKDYLEKKFNIKVKYLKKNYMYYYTIITIIFLSLIIVLIILYYKKQYKNILLLFLVLLILFVLILLINFKTKLLYKKKLKKNILNYKDINFKSGDILQNSVGMDLMDISPYASLLFDINYFHNSIIIDYNNEKYILYMSPNIENHNSDKLILSDNIPIHIMRLKDYLYHNRYNYHYRLFQTNHNIDISHLFNYIENINKKKISFLYNPKTNFLKNNNNSNSKYNCLTFILIFLMRHKIIPEMNYNTMIPDDILFLNKLSNNYYNSPIYFVYK